MTTNELRSVGPKVRSGAAGVRTSVLRRTRSAKYELERIIAHWNEGARIWLGNDEKRSSPGHTFPVGWRHRTKAEYPENHPTLMMNDATTLRALAGQLERLAGELDERAHRLRASAELARLAKADAAARAARLVRDISTR